MKRRLLLVSPLAFAGCAQPVLSPPKVDLPPTFTKDGLMVKVDGLLFQRYDVAGVRGIAKNVSGRDFKLVNLSFDVLNAEGLKVADAFANTAGLGAGQTWAFDALIVTARPRPFTAISLPRVTVM